MASYKVRFARSAEKDLRGIPKEDLKRLIDGIHGLSEDPRPSGCTKLTGSDLYRIRQGDWRVLYEINDSERWVDVARIGNRREIYK
jgi:mRNA interferase RelE/StbE